MKVDGIILVDKPSGPSAFEVVRRIRSHLGCRKAGHAGTLDPLATGLLVVCLGEATRLVQFLIEDDKAYEGSLVLGIETDTLDAEGTVRSIHEVPASTGSRLQGVIEQFEGKIDQTPPMHSAIKLKGVPLYKLARQGKEVERPTREVEIHEIRLGKVEIPRVDFQVRCSKGTYIRSLAADIGTALGCGAHLASLRRTQSGCFSIDQTFSLDRILAAGAGEVRERMILTLRQALPTLPEIDVDAETAARVRHGQCVEIDGVGIGAGSETGDLVKLIHNSGLIAVARILRVLDGGEGGRKLHVRGAKVLKDAPNSFTKQSHCDRSSTFPEEAGCGR